MSKEIYMRTIDQEKLEQLFSALKSRYNIDLSNYAPASLSRRLERFINLFPFESERALEEKLLNDRQLFEQFIKEITVNTTEMFRDPSCWEAIRAEIVPIAAAHQNLRIWHAGCSSGEEVYSMAILLEEEGLLEKTKIIASDVNREVMQTAMNGKYSLKGLETNSDNYKKSGGKYVLEDYIETGKGFYQMKNGLLRNVQFMKHDLSSGTAFSKFDIILCRNVMIYFNKALQETVFRLFHQSLFKKGMIVIGKKESMAYYSGVSSFIECNPSEKIYKLK